MLRREDLVVIKSVCEMNNFKQYNGELNVVGNCYGRVGEMGNWVFFEEIGSFR